jgi:hypothetical protein
MAITVTTRFVTVNHHETKVRVAHNEKVFGGGISSVRPFRLVLIKITRWLPGQLPARDQPLMAVNSLLQLLAMSLTRQRVVEQDALPVRHQVSA